MTDDAAPDDMDLNAALRQHHNWDEPELRAARRSALDRVMRDPFEDVVDPGRELSGGAVGSSGRTTRGCPTTACSPCAAREPDNLAKARMCVSLMIMGDKLTAQQRRLRARAAAHASWAKTKDRCARTEPARRAALARFEKQVDPDGVLTEQERARRAEHARRAHFLALAMRSAHVRRRSRGRTSDQ